MGWAFVGEGAANAVLAWRGPGGPGGGAGAVVRLRKAGGGAYLAVAAGSRRDAEALEREVWGPGGGSGATVDFTERYLRPVLGTFAWGGPISPLRADELPGGAPALLEALPERLSAPGALADPLDGLLLADAAAVPPGRGPPEVVPVLCLEIKPKSGVPLAAADWRGLRPAGAPQDAPAGVSFYAMQQARRLAEGRVPRASSYCPLELFSGDLGRASAALLHLMQEPQNHFKAFRDGEALPELLVPESLVPGGPPRRKIGGSPLRALAEDVLGGPREPWGPWPGEQRLARVLAQILVESGVLERVLRAQQRDAHGLLRAQAAAECLSAGALDVSSREAAREALRDFSIGATAKDCAIMVVVWADAPSRDCEWRSTTRRHHNKFDYATCCGRLQGPHAPGGIFYRVSVIDLDRKPLAKIPGKVEDRRRTLHAFHEAGGAGQLPPP